MFYSEIAENVSISKTTDGQKAWSVLDTIWMIVYSISLFFFVIILTKWDILKFDPMKIAMGAGGIATLFFLIVAIFGLVFEMRRASKSHKIWFWITMLLSFVITGAFGILVSKTYSFDLIPTVAFTALSIQFPYLFAKLFAFAHNRSMYSYNYAESVGDQDYQAYASGKIRKINGLSTAVSVIIELAMLAFIVIIFIVPMINKTTFETIQNNVMSSSLVTKVFKGGGITTVVAAVIKLIATIIGAASKKRRNAQ